MAYNQGFSLQLLFSQPTIVTDNYTGEKCLPPHYPYAKVCSVVVSMTAYSRTNFKDSGELLLQQLQLGRSKKERCAAGRQAVFRDSCNFSRYTISPSVEIDDVISQLK